MAGIGPQALAQFGGGIEWGAREFDLPTGFQGDPAPPGEW
jgi:hypothetical protein